jgi:hypothetical protein
MTTLASLVRTSRFALGRKALPSLFGLAVIPAKAGTQTETIVCRVPMWVYQSQVSLDCSRSVHRACLSFPVWVPAFAGMTS